MKKYLPLFLILIFVNACSFFPGGDTERSGGVTAQLIVNPSERDLKYDSPVFAIVEITNNDDIDLDGEICLWDNLGADFSGIDEEECYSLFVPKIYEGDKAMAEKFPFGRELYYDGEDFAISGRVTYFKDEIERTTEDFCLTGGRDVDEDLEGCPDKETIVVKSAEIRNIRKEINDVDGDGQNDNIYLEFDLNEKCKIVQPGFVYEENDDNFLKNIVDVRLSNGDSFECEADIKEDQNRKTIKCNNYGNIIGTYNTKAKITLKYGCELKLGPVWRHYKDEEGG